MSRSAYSKLICWVCGRRISSCGLASVNHKRKHVREGIMKELPHEFGRCTRFEIVDRKKMKELYPNSPLIEFKEQKEQNANRSGSTR